MSREAWTTTPRLGYSPCPHTARMSWSTETNRKDGRWRLWRFSNAKRCIALLSAMTSWVSGEEGGEIIDKPHWYQKKYVRMTALCDITMEDDLCQGAVYRIHAEDSPKIH